MKKEEVHILIVEDNKEMSDSCVNSLMVAGYKKITTATNGEEAWEILKPRKIPDENKWQVSGDQNWEIKRSEKIDLVITDVQMPEMDGFQLLTNIRGDETYKNLPVIVMSTIAEYSKKASELGANRFFRKNSTSKLEDVIEELF